MSRSVALLVVEPCERAVETRVVASLQDHGIEPATPAPRAAALVLFDRPSADVVTTVRSAAAGGGRVVTVAAHSSALEPGYAWQLLATGASDVIAWDHGSDPAAAIVARLERWERVDAILGSPAVANELVGTSPAWRSALRQVIEVALYTDAPILITGESGTGKELAARLIHTLDPRPDKGALVLLDCTTVVPTLSGSEFFGHERGAFTGAVTPRDGALALADGGTLFLDEVGELPLTLQAELLRAVQEGTYKRVGSNIWRRTKFRLICATNRDLAAEAAAGTFRRDFYHRIAAWTCRMPALRERTEDIPLLVSHFLRAAVGGEAPELDDAVRTHLVAREYPGNVRDLRNLVVRIGHRHVGSGPITPGDLPEDEREAARRSEPDWRDGEFERAIKRAIQLGAGLREVTAAAAEAAIVAALSAESGSVRGASRRLGVTERALQLRRAARGHRGALSRGAQALGIEPS